MDYPPSCSAWSRVVTSENSRFIITSRTMSNTFEPIETERFYCEPEDDSMSDERGGYSSGTPVVAPPEEFRDHSSEWSSSRRGSQTSQSPSPTPVRHARNGRQSSPIPRHCNRSSSPLRSSHGTRASSPLRPWGRSSSPGPLRPSSSHNSLTRRRQDDSTFITSAISHDTITDLYNVPVGSDIYTLPVDTIPRPRHSGHKKKHLREKRRRRYTSTGSEISEKERKGIVGEGDSEEPVHMTLQEVRQFLHNLYSSGDNQHANKQKEKSQRNSIGYLLKKALCSVFRLKSKSSRQREESKVSTESNKVILLEAPRSIAERALPPLPTTPPPVPTLTSHPAPTHFAASLDRVKDCGWYWGPVSGEAAEKILANEPDGSFIVRDSSDDHYIFSLTFRLNGTVRHVRIEHDQGNFSFGSCTKFKSQTIVDFIETAVEHSRSGRYLFFLHRRPILGPMRVQLLHPVSRFKHIQSLQHLCRFVIVKTVRRDLISELPLPRRLIDYLNSPHYYSEQLADQVEPDLQSDQMDSEPPSHSPVHLVSFAPPPPPPPNL